MYKTCTGAIFSLIILISCSSPKIGKQRVLGGSGKDELMSMCLTKDGGFIVGGFSYSQKEFEKTSDNHGIIFGDYWVIKFNKKEEIEWQKTIGGSNAEIFRWISTTDDGGYILAGESASDSSGDKTENCRGGSDIWVVKLDSAGNIQWDKTVGGSSDDVPTKINQTSDGGFIIGGHSNSNISGDKTENCRGNFDFWAIKLSRSGKIEWTRTLGGSEFEFCLAMELTDDGGVILCGNSASDKSGEKSENNKGAVADFWIVKLDMKGNVQWDKAYGGNDDDFCSVIKKTNDGNFILAGSSKSNISNEKSEDSRGLWDYWLVKIDKDGNKIWDKTFGGNGNDQLIMSLLLLKDGGYIIGGRSDSGISGDKTESCRGDYDFWLVKIDKAGNKVWDKTIGGNGFEEVRGMEEIKNGNYIIAGFSWSDKSGDRMLASRGESDYWIVDLSAN